MASIAKFDEWQNSAGTKFGAVLQSANVIKTNSFTSTATGWNDIPGLSVVITPSNASNKILITAYVSGCGQSSTTHIQLRLVRNSTEIGSGVAEPTSTGCFGFLPVAMSGDWVTTTGLTFLDNPSSTSAQTYKIQFRNNNSTGTIYINRSNALSGVNYPLTSSQITVQEIQA
jgi:hypothetical protein